MVRRRRGGRLFELWAGLSLSILMLAHPALSHSLNILFIIFEKMNSRGVGREGSAGIKYSVSFYGEEEEADCSNCGLFYP